MTEVKEKKTKKIDVKKVLVKVLAIFAILLMMSSMFFTCIYYAISALK